VITCRVYGHGSLQEETPFEPAVIRAASDGDHRLWLDVIDPSDEELASLQAELGLHELAVEDSRKWGQRAKVDFYPGHLFLVAHGIELDGTGELVDRFEDLADDVEDDVAEQEDGAGNDVHRRLSQRIFRLRQQVVRFRRLASPMRETVDLLLEEPTVATGPLVPYYRDVLDHVIRTLELTDNVRDLLTSARELQLAQASNRLNVVMKQLSAWAAIILIPTLIAGIYGMNFDHMPELDWRLGYPFALGVMAVAAFALWRVFKKREWL
jgi:Mg2+ and Co2+ transporter CorA